VPIDSKPLYFASDVHNWSCVIHLKQVFYGVYDSNIEHKQAAKFYSRNHTKLELSKGQSKWSRA